MTHFIAGPVEIYPEIKDILSKEYTYFRNSEYSEITIKCLNKIQKMLNNSTKNSTIYLASSGTGAMEAVVDNCLNENDKVLIVNGGTFGERFCEILTKFNILYDSIDLKWNEVVTKEHLSQYDNKGYSALLVNLHETSSGKLYDIKLLSDFCKKNNLLFIVDAISTFLADDYDMQENNIDVTIISSQKGLCLSPGMSIISMSQKMIDRIQSNKTKSYYFDFKKYLKEIERGQTPFTPPVFIMYELQAMLNLIENNGGKDIWIKSIAEKAQYFRKKAQEIGLTIPNYPKSNFLTPVYFKNTDARKIAEYLGEKFQIYVNPCSGDLSDKMLRISHVGNITYKDIDNLLEKIMQIINSFN